MEKGARRTGKTRMGDRAALHRRVPSRTAPAPQHRGARRPVPRNRPHSRADRVHRRHRAQRLRLPHLGRHLFRHGRQPDYGYLARLDMAGLEAGKRVELGEKRASYRLRVVEVLAAGREAADGMGQPVGSRLSRMAHRMLGDGAEIPRRLLRHPLRRRRPHPGPSHQRDRADRGARGHAARQLLDARLLPARRTTPRWRSRRASSCASQALVDRGYDPIAYRYLCLTGHYRTPAQLHVGGARRRRDGAADRMRSGFHALARRPGARPDAFDVERFTAIINDDLNLPRALAVAWETFCAAICRAGVKRATLARFDRVFGLGLAEWHAARGVAPADVKALADARAAARKARQLGRSRSTARRVAREPAGKWKTVPTATCSSRARGAIPRAGSAGTSANRAWMRQPSILRRISSLADRV